LEITEKMREALSSSNASYVLMGKMSEDFSEISAPASERFLGSNSSV